MNKSPYNTDSRASLGVCIQSTPTPACEEGEDPLLRTTQIAAQSENKKASDSGKRVKTINLRCSKNEKTIFTEIAKRLGIGLSELLRKAVLKIVNAAKLIIPKEKKEACCDERLLKEVNKIGININQIAHAINLAISQGDEINYDDLYVGLIKATIALEKIVNRKEDLNDK